MNIFFHKYQGTGNDFVMIDNREGGFPRSTEYISSLCDRRFGIGADGLILLEQERGFDFKMVYFNADGREGSMCGNGGRCVVRFAHDLGLFRESVRFIATDGAHDATADSKSISLKMSNVKSIEDHGDFYFTNTGSPHVVIYVDQVDDTDVVSIGRSIRYGEQFGPKGGTNVNFAEIVGENHLKVRTYERGVEDETFSCGTGVTACALTTYQRMGWDGPVRVDVKGGHLLVDFVADEDGSFTEIFLTGPAEKVFEGSVPEHLLYLENASL